MPINNCGKLVVAKDSSEVEGPRELVRWGRANGVTLELISLAEAERLEPNIKSVECALYSPLAATVDPIEVCSALTSDLRHSNVEIMNGFEYPGYHGEGKLQVGATLMRATKIVNGAGLYADKITHDFDFGTRYIIMAFKGLYLRYVKNKDDIRTNISSA